MITILSLHSIRSKSNRTGQISRKILLQSKSEKKKFLMFFKKLSIDAKIDDLLAPPVGSMGNKFQISNWEVRLVMHLWKSLFETKLLIQVVLTCNDY